MTVSSGGERQTTTLEGRRSIEQTGLPSRHFCSLWPPSMDPSPWRIHCQPLFLLGSFHSHHQGAHGRVLPTRAGSPTPPANPKSARPGSAGPPAILTTTPSPSSLLHLILLFLFPGDLFLWIFGCEHHVLPVSPRIATHPDLTHLSKESTDDLPGARGQECMLISPPA